jgi:antitoxin (DNA-binding transcriptional repressor) of toxin-antitoxin stability system
MRSVGIKVLKNKLSEYVRLAEGGETVLVTDRDLVVAELVPPRMTRSPVIADAFLAELVRKGWLSPPVGHDPGPVARKPVAAWSDIANELDADRGDR